MILLVLKPAFSSVFPNELASVGSLLPKWETGVLSGGFRGLPDATLWFWFHAPWSILRLPTLWQ